jgi:hypothetical protein
MRTDPQAGQWTRESVAMGRERISGYVRVVKKKVMGRLRINGKDREVSRV